MSHHGIEIYWLKTHGCHHCEDLRYRPVSIHHDESSPLAGTKKLGSGVESGLTHIGFHQAHCSILDKQA